MKISKLGLRFYISGALFLVAGIGFVLALGAYGQQAEQTFSPSPGNGDTETSLVIQELKGQLETTNPGPARYSIIAEQNLFSPDREAWMPPQPKPDPPKEEEPPPPSPTNRNDVALHGTYLSGGEKRAILSFRHFRSAPKSRILTEGQEARDEDGNARISYTVKEIHEDRVELEDSRQQTFSVGLFDNKKSSPQATQQKTTIEVEQGAIAGPVASASASTGDGGGSSASSAQKKGQGGDGDALSTADVNRMDQEDKDRLVEEGKLRKINTPFGNVYKPVK